jgi:Protein of unknown function (DUF2845)
VEILWNRVLAAVMGGLFLGSAKSDELFHCGSKIIEVGMTQAEVREHCGEPTSATTEAQDVRSGNQVVGKTEMHRWTYESYRATRVLIFDKEILKSIQ